MREFKEGNALTVTGRFMDGRTQIIPTTVHYKLVNLTTSSTVIDWTSVAPSQEVDIDISGLLVKVQRSSNRYEIYEATVVADKDTATQIANAERWKVKNLHVFS